MSDSDDFFCKLLTISFPFQIKKEKFKFFFKISKYFRKCSFRPKNRKLATLQNRLHKFKNDCQIRNQRPKIGEVRYFLGFDIFFVDQCNYCILSKIEDKWTFRTSANIVE